MLQQSYVSCHQRRGRKSQHLPEGKIPRHHRQHSTERLVADVTAARRRFHDFVGKKFLRILRVIAAHPRAFRRFIDRRPESFSHFRRHHPPETFFFFFKYLRRLQHHLRSLAERHVPVSPKRIRRRLQLHLNLRVRQRFECFLHFSGGWVYGCDRHFSSLLAILSSLIDSGSTIVGESVLCPYRWNGNSCGSTSGVVLPILVGPLYPSRLHATN